MTSSEAKAIALAYLGKDVAIKVLGFGVDGYALLVPEMQRVLKIFEDPEKYAREVAAYSALSTAHLRSVLGLTIPEYFGFDDDRLVLEIGLVEPPFLLDFASVRLEEPDFEEGIYAGWLKRLEFRFGSNTWFVLNVYHELAKHGIYYLDFHRGNLDFTGIEGIDPEDHGLDEEPSP